MKTRPGFTIREADAYYEMWCYRPGYRDKIKGVLQTVGCQVALLFEICLIGLGQNSSKQRLVLAYPSLSRDWEV
jgi:hypothetical protein